MHHGVDGDEVLEVLVLRFRRQLAVEQEVAGFQERAAFGKLVDRIAAIEQDALVAIDEGDLRLAAGGRGEAGVVGEAPGLLVERVDVDHVGPQRALLDRQVVSGAIDQDGCLARARHWEVLCDAHLKAPMTILWDTVRRATQRTKAAVKAPANPRFLHCRIFAPILPQCNKPACSNVKQILLPLSDHANAQETLRGRARPALRRSRATWIFPSAPRGAAAPPCRACARSPRQKCAPTLRAPSASRARRPQGAAEAARSCRAPGDRAV